MNLLRHHGLELAVFEPEDVLQSKDEFKEQATKQGAESFRRLVRVSGPFDNLRTHLSTFEGELRTLAESCRAKIIPFRWGICRESRRFTNQWQYTQPSLPAGYLMAAEVTVVLEGAELSGIDYELKKREFEQGVEIYRSDAARRPHRIKDIDINQTMYGHLATHIDQEDGLWYVDIEPRIGRKTGPTIDTPSFKGAQVIE